jgi:hypothetical protein
MRMALWCGSPVRDYQAERQQISRPVATASPASPRSALSPRLEVGASADLEQRVVGGVDAGGQVGGQEALVHRGRRGGTGLHVHRALRDAD